MNSALLHTEKRHGLFVLVKHLDGVFDGVRSSAIFLQFAMKIIWSFMMS